MYLTFLAYTAWVFVWVWQLTLWWAWWLPAAFVLPLLNFARPSSSRDDASQ